MKGLNKNSRNDPGEYKISVIVPIYQSEKYLHRCVESILRQRHRNIELILIDDGSNDKSGLICDEYALKDDRIIVIHQDNQGASAARNTGLELASGQYIMFCDSDDIVSPYWISRLLFHAEPGVLPIGAYCHESRNLGQYDDRDIKPGYLYDHNSYYMFNSAGVAGYLCNALYDRNIIENHRMRMREQSKQGDYNEDLIFALNYINYIKHIVYTGYTDYCYQVREDSMSHSYQRYYFEKYQEKYLLWKNYLQGCQIDVQKQEIKKLATTSVYHFLVALKQEVILGNTESYKKFKHIIYAEEMQECVCLADLKNENTFVFKCIKNRWGFLLWMRLRFSFLWKGKRR